MISQIIVAFSSLVGRIISKLNSKEVKKYEKYIKIAQYSILILMMFFIPLAIPFIIVLILNVRYNTKKAEVISKGGILFFNSYISLLLLLIYELLEGRKYKLKKIFLYDLATISTYFILLIISKLF